MNWKTIALTAALLALQAAVLSLLHGGAAQAETVYRCARGQYQASPCAPDAAARQDPQVLELSDQRSEAQLAEALVQRHGTLRHNRPHARHRETTAVQRAAALSAHSAGMAPFHNGRWLSDAQKPHETISRPKRTRYFKARVAATP